MTQQEVVSMQALAMSIIENTAKKKRMTFHIYAPKEVIDNPDILKDSEKIKTLLNSNWWVKTYERELTMPFDSLLMLIQIVAHLKITLSQIKYPTSTVNATSKFKDPNFFSGEEIIATLKSVTIANMSY